ncbi:MAG: hypothetical protein ACYCUM_08010 [Solirubrobacteraceae bacterium]
MSAPEVGATRRARAAAIAAVRLRRRVQLTLAAFWIIDALLQSQPPNFTPHLVYATILGNVENQPEPISGSILAAVHVLGPHAVALNVAIVLVELALGAGLLSPRSVKLALACSVAWALGVWWLGEGFGGLFAGEATLLVGAPGAALLYALVAIVAWPVERARARTVAGAGALGEPRALRAWALLWVGGALLRVAPFWFAPVYALQADFQNGLNEEPGWLLHLGESLSRFARNAGLALPIALALLEATIGLGVLLCSRRRRVLLAAGMLLSCLYWVVGEQLGGLLTGRATDLGAAPLYVLLAVTLWPLRGGESRRTVARRRGQDRRATITGSLVGERVPPAGSAVTRT